MLSLTGFTSTSVIGLFHDKLPYIAATLVNGMSDRRVQFQMAELWAKESKLSCPEFFSWWSSHLIGLTLDDYRTLKNFACHLEPEHFNAFVDLFHEETKIWNKPAVEYRPHFATLAGELYGVAMAISRALQRGATFEAPFTDRYFMKATRTMKNALDVKMKKVKYSTVSALIINLKKLALQFRILLMCIYFFKYFYRESLKLLIRSTLLLLQSIACSFRPFLRQSTILHKVCKDLKLLMIKLKFGNCSQTIEYKN